jgi:nitrogen fixation protein NifU and related proteins
MTDSKQLYQEVILDHNRKPRNWGTLTDATHKAEGHNPLCGDHLSLTLRLNGDAIDAINFQGESCAICKASASMMTTAVKDKSRRDAEELIEQFRDMAIGRLDVTKPNRLGRLVVFAGVRDLPTRVKCAILPWHTLHAAFNSIASTTTEAEEDPMHAPIGGSA